MSTLKLEPGNKPSDQIKMDTARIAGIHEGIKMVIEEIQKIERMNAAYGFEFDRSLNKLKNKLGILVYKDWKYA